MRAMQLFTRGLIVSVLAANAMASGRAAFAYPSQTVDLEGHGFGHGLGMGAWGAHGMAVHNPGKPGEEIALHYFPGARVDRAANDDVRAWLDYDAPIFDTVVTAGDPATLRPRGATTFTIHDSSGNQVATSDAVWSFWRVRREGDALRLQRAQDSGGAPGGWEGADQQAATVAGVVEFRPPPGPQDAPSKMLQVLTGTTWRYFRGAAQGILVGGEVYTVNVATVQEYMYGVMRIEGSPARWGPSVSEPGPGKEGLRGLAIVARSFALHKRAAARAAGQPYDVCSTSNCQNYRGWGFVQGEGEASVTVVLEDARTNAAVDTTAWDDGSPKVLLYGSDPTPILGAYASSSGGYTKPGPHPYLSAVPDPDDDIPENPSHRWLVSIPVSAVEAAWPQIGGLVSFRVTRRNGFGDFGGRVLEAHIEGTAGSVTVTGDQVRARLGLKSDWFRVLAPGGYWLVASDGGVFTFGSAPFFGSAGGTRLARPIVGMDPRPQGDGYWSVASDGGVFSFGAAGFFGSTGGTKLNAPVTALAASPSGNGYWLVASDGGIFTFGDARFLGSTGGTKLNQPIVAMAATGSGNGYWLVAKDGGVFSFGDAAFLGSTGAMKLNQPIVGAAATPGGDGYWLVAADGGVFAFGNAAFHGSAGSIQLTSPITSMAASTTGAGYRLGAADGGVFTFGDAPYFGSAGGMRLAAPIVAISSS